jgi:hypothetical protein
MANYFEFLINGAFSIEDDAGFDFTNDVELRWDAHSSDWNVGGTNQEIFARYDSTGGNRVLRVNYSPTANRINFDFGDAAGAFRATVSVDPSPALQDGIRIQFRANIDADDGGNTVVTVFTRQGNALVDLSSNDNWTQVGSNSVAGVQAWKNVASPIWVGSNWNDAASRNFIGRLYRILGWTDLTQTTKFIDVDFTNSTNQTTAGDETEWNDGASSNTWDAQGTENTDWRYVYVKLDNLVDPLSLYGFDSDAIDLQPFRGKALGTH